MKRVDVGGAFVYAEGLLLGEGRNAENKTRFWS